MTAWRATGREVLTVAQMMEADRLAVVAGVPSLTLMENAGRAVADEICRRWAPQPVAVLSGPGNNGGDGYVCARYLKDRGWPVSLFTYGDHGALKGDAAATAKKWRGPTARVTNESIAGASIVVDALFGSGLNKPLSDDAAAILQELAKRQRSREAVVISVDVPSGIHGDGGAPSPASIAADLTVTFFRKKRAHVLRHSNMGEIVVADIGIPASVLDTTKPSLFENAPECWAPAPWLARDATFDGHKYQRGHVFVVSGHMSSTGAARLAARAALRAGCGLVTVLSPPDALAVNAAHLTAIMLRRFSSGDDLRQIISAKSSPRSVVIGPANGVGDETKANVSAALSLGIPTVIDADALTSFADDPDVLFSSLHGDCVLTPHSGEFARLFPSLATNQPIDTCIAAAAKARCVVVLKGAITVVAEPSGYAVVNTNAPSWLATAGSGDVLAGMIASLMAQGEPAFSATAAAVWMHADAARRFGRGLIAEDLPEQLPSVARALENRR